MENTFVRVENIKQEKVAMSALNWRFGCQRRATVQRDNETEKRTLIIINNDTTRDKMQTFFVPDKIQIYFGDNNNNPLRQDKILIGMRIFANHKNDIDLSPFLTDSLGSLTITSADIKKRYDNFVSYGLMDYSSLETAKSGIEIYFWGNKRLDRYINYWTKLLNGNKDLKQFEQREREELILYETCYNRTTKFSDDIILVNDDWGKPNNELKYKVKFDMK